MSYLSIEQSIHSGQPQELYRFALGSYRWLYTSGQSQVVYMTEIYLPATIKRSAIEQADELSRVGINVSMPRDLELVKQFIAAPPHGVVSLTIYRNHIGDNEYVTIFKGRVTNVSLSRSEATLRCEPITVSLRRMGLRARYQLMCRHILYSALCGVQPNNFKVTGTINHISGLSVQVGAAATRPDGYFTAGMLEADTGVRMITAHNGTNITLIAPIIGLEVGSIVSLYAGCDHSMMQCQSKFNNLNNFGGFPFIPIKNPFSGDAIV